jgi:hypothetical protein
MNNLRVIYWNVYCLPAFATSDKMPPEDRAKLIIPYFEGYDVAILNEAWTDDAKQVFKTAYPYSYQTGKKFFKILDSGLLVLSKYPILNASNILYTRSSNWDWFASKGALHFQVNTPKGVYDFFTTHMQAGDMIIDHKIRPFQFMELVKFVNKNLPSSNNVFLIGDFNVMPLINGDISGHCTDLDDALLRSACYYTIPMQTGLVDLQKGDNIKDVYHIFSKRHDPIVAYHNSDGITDGPYITVTIPLV